MALKTPKTVLITGCSNGGIGSALAMEFHKRGHIVFAGVRNLAKGSDLAKLPNVTLLNLDVTSKESITGAVNVVDTTAGGKGLDVLINNAGQGAPSPLVDADLNYARRLFDVNFWGVLETTQAFARLVVKAKGTIVNICSVGALIPTPYLGMYGASKAAMKMASDTLRIEMKPLGVRVITAMVGMVGSKFSDNLSDVTLPDDALFKPVESFINDTPGGQRGNMGNVKMPVNDFARRLTLDILNGKSGLVYRGGMATISNLAYWIFPSWLLEWTLSRGCGLDKLAKTKFD